MEKYATVTTFSAGEAVQGAATRLAAYQEMKDFSPDDINGAWGWPAVSISTTAILIRFEVPMRSSGLSENYAILSTCAALATRSWSILVRMRGWLDSR